MWVVRIVIGGVYWRLLGEGSHHRGLQEQSFQDKGENDQERWTPFLRVRTITEYKGKQVSWFYSLGVSGHGNETASPLQTEPPQAKEHGVWWSNQSFEQHKAIHKKYGWNIVLNIRGTRKDKVFPSFNQTNENIDPVLWREGGWKSRDGEPVNKERNRKIEEKSTENIWGSRLEWKHTQTGRIHKDRRVWWEGEIWGVIDNFRLLW